MIDWVEETNDAALDFERMWNVERRPADWIACEMTVLPLPGGPLHEHRVFCAIADQLIANRGR